ncbi:hypothetical protein QBC45DRAFT_92152 [Copromyces sp. CBS 386.78]|nr:hypothetical protein QBC45DRAFT_92152 [Copromyces sp. CBS 386.78]
MPFAALSLSSISSSHAFPSYLPVLFLHLTVLIFVGVDRSSSYGLGGRDLPNIVASNLKRQGIHAIRTCLGLLL